MNIIITQNQKNIKRYLPHEIETREKAGDIPGEKEYWRVYKRYKYKADRKIISKSEFNQWNYMSLELKQECAEGKITVNDMLKRIEVFENRKKVAKK